VLEAPSAQLPGHDNIGTDDPDTIGHLIHCLYHGDYIIQPKLLAEGDMTRRHDDDRTLSQHAKVLAAAVKYDVPPLKALAEAYYAAAMTEWDHITSYSVMDVAEIIQVVYPFDQPHFHAMRKVLSGGLLLAHGSSSTMLEDKRIADAIESTPGAGLEISRHARYFLQDIVKRRDEKLVKETEEDEANEEDE